MKDVKRAVKSLNRQADILLARSPGKSHSQTNNAMFDSARYFYVSNRMACCFPHLWESVVIASVHTTSPPPHLLREIIASDNSQGQQSEITPSRVTAANNTGMVHQMMHALWTFCTYVFRQAVVLYFTLIFFFATTNIRMQKTVITTCQPLFLAAICYAYYNMKSGGWVMVVPAVLLITALYIQFRQHSKDSTTRVKSVTNRVGVDEIVELDGVDGDAGGNGSLPTSRADDETLLQPSNEAMQSFHQRSVLLLNSLHQSTSDLQSVSDQLKRLSNALEEAEYKRAQVSSGDRDSDMEHFWKLKVESMQIEKEYLRDERRHIQRTRELIQEQLGLIASCSSQVGTMGVNVTGEEEVRAGMPPSK